MKRLFLRAFWTITLMLAGVGGLTLLPGGRAFAQGVASTAVSPGSQFDTFIGAAKASMMTDPASTLRSAQAAEAVARHMIGSRSVTAVATALWLQGEAKVRLNDLVNARPLIDRALAMVRPGPPSKLTGDLLLSKGALETVTADVAGALSAYQQAHNIFRDIGETRSRAIALISIAILYQEARDYPNALKYDGEALDVYQGDPQLLFSIYGSRGIIYGETKEFAKSQVEFDRALQIARTLRSPILEARMLRNIAHGQLQAGQLAAADATIAQGFRVSGRDEEPMARNQFLLLSAASAKLHGRWSDAERLIAQAFAGVDITSTTLDWHEGHLIAYEIYKNMGDSAQALAHLEALKRLDDKTATLASSANTALAAAHFNFANQELNIEKMRRAELQRNIVDAKLRARNQQTIFGGVAVATVIIVALLAFGLITIRRSRNEVRAANVDLGKTNAALGKALAAKTEFLATTSHEIRTPLNGILGMTQVMLADDSLREPVRDRIEVVHGAGLTMRALVDDILDIAKMETGNLTIESVPLDLKRTLHEASRLWEEQALAKGVGFTLDLDHCPAFIEGDAARLRQIAFNLLSNALKFTATGGVTLRASATGSRLSIAVSDSGIGIPSDKLGIIFESFRQVDAGTTRRFGGTGLGLAICRNLAQAMGGDIAVTSVDGQGSTFTIDLPLVLATAPFADPAESGSSSDALLIIDRNPISRSTLRAVLESRADTILFAASAEEALVRIGKGGVTRTLIDDATIKASPDLDAALGVLGASNTTTALLWAAPTDDDRARFAAAGIDHVIAKPISGAALAAILFDESVLQRLVTQAA